MVLAFVSGAVIADGAYRQRNSCLWRGYKIQFRRVGEGHRCVGLIPRIPGEYFIYYPHFVGMQASAQRCGTVPRERTVDAMQRNGRLWAPSVSQSVKRSLLGGADNEGGAAPPFRGLCSGRIDGEHSRNKTRSLAFRPSSNDQCDRN